MIDPWLHWIVILANVVGGAYLPITALRGAGRWISFLVGILFGALAWIFPSAGVITLIMLALGGIGVTVWIKRQTVQFAHSQLVFEGGGIRRGLTAVEVGTLFDVFPGGLLAVSVSALLQKGILAKEDNGGESSLRVIPEFQANKETINPAKRTEERKSAARAEGKVLFGEEDMLLEMFWQGISPNSENFPITRWVEKVYQECDHKIGGFDRAQSTQYYRNYMAHRLMGVEKEFFSEEEFVPWMVLEVFAQTDSSGQFHELLNKTRPAWLHEGESLIDWAQTTAGLRIVAD